MYRINYQQVGFKLSNGRVKFPSREIAMWECRKKAQKWARRGYLGDDNITEVENGFKVFNTNSEHLCTFTIEEI